MSHFHISHSGDSPIPGFPVSPIIRFPLLPVRLERCHLAQRIVEITAETDGPIVDEHVRRRFPPGNGTYEIVELVRPEPAAHTNRMAGCEDDDVETAGAERFEEGAGARSRRVPVIGVLPAGVGIEDAVQIDADDGALRVVEVQPDHLTIIFRMSADSRAAARSRLNELLSALGSLPPHDHIARLREEAEALDRAIAAFHLEGIRFRMYNVDRLVTHSPVPMPANTPEIVADVRHHLEAAGFHTRSHQAPGSPRD
jgi:hypothetical protein